MVVVESENTEKNRQFVERLGKKLTAETNTFTDVFYKGDLTMMGRKALLFVPESDLEDMRSTLTNFIPVHPAVHPRHQPRFVVRAGQLADLPRQTRGQCGK